jgi:hypothetical protein
MRCALIAFWGIFRKYCYFTIPVVAFAILLILDFNFKIFKYISTNSNIMMPTLIGISGTLIGFLITAVTIFLSLPKENHIMKNVKKYGHDKIFIRCSISISQSNF